MNITIDKAPVRTWPEGVTTLGDALSFLEQVILRPNARVIDTMKGDTNLARNVNDEGTLKVTTIGADEVARNVLSESVDSHKKLSADLDTATTAFASMKNDLEAYKTLAILSIKIAQFTHAILAARNVLGMDTPFDTAERLAGIIGELAAACEQKDGTAIYDLIEYELKPTMSSLLAG